MNASVVIRARDEAHSIGRTLELLARQSLPHEVIVVDSGSRDRTVEIARARGARVIELPAERFSFGRALNLGAAAATAPVVVSLSAHAFPPDDEWLSRMVGALADSSVACASGETRSRDGSQLTGAVRLGADADPFWGYSNGAGAFRAELWRERPFREDLPGSEDREWARHWAARGRVSVIDPALAVEHDHSRDPVRVAFERYRREQRGFAMFLELEPYGLRDALAEWWGDQGWHRSRARARLDPRRAARLAGKWWGRRGA